jgi:PTH1 family peptidyl-tRNA hydrolase
MNLSGDAISPLLASSTFDPSRDLLVVVDDIALPLGSFRLRARGSAGGHNGLQSIEDALGTDQYARLRIGIGPVPDWIDDTADYVLESFDRDELATLADLLPTLADAVECWLVDGIEPAMNRFNRRGTGDGEAE